MASGVKCLLRQARFGTPHPLPCPEQREDILDRLRWPFLMPNGAGMKSNSINDCRDRDPHYRCPSVLITVRIHG